MNKFSSLKAFLVCLFFIGVLPAVAIADDDYVIGDGDGLEIAVWGETQLNAKVTVRPDGKITLPGVGDVTASGFTPKNLSLKLSEKLEEFVKKPIVTVTVTGITNNKIYIFFGQGVTPGVQSAASADSGVTPFARGVTSGVHNLPARTTLLKFLSKFGSFKGADMERAYIIRDGKKLDVNFYDLFIKFDLSKDIMLKTEDIIYIPDNELSKIYVMGAVNSPKTINYREHIKILDAILEAGNFTKYARENSVLILRKDSNSTKEITVKVKDLMKDGDLSQNISLVPGDFVIVKEGIF